MRQTDDTAPVLSHFCEKPLALSKKYTIFVRSSRGDSHLGYYAQVSGLH